MKRTAKTISGVVLCAWLWGCGGGTLGGNGGMIGTVTGAAGVIGPGSGSAAVGGGVGSAGFGGDIAPPPVGRGGAGGRGGASGRVDGGMDATGGVGVCTIDNPVCGSLCGNGQIESCARQPAVGCPVQVVSEDCDGANLGSFSCESIGYSAGKPTCRSDCTIDLSPCSFCVPSASVFSCGPTPEHAVPEDQTLGWFALAAKDTEIGLAMAGYSNVNGAEMISFARLSPALGFLHLTTLDDGSVAGPFSAGWAYGMAVAPIPSGWVVAVCGDREIFIHALDDAGNDVGRTVVEKVSRATQTCSGLVLAKRPNGGPLLVWLDQEGLQMSMIADDGRSASPPQTIVDGSIALTGDSVGAAWVGDEFAVAVGVDTTHVGGQYALRLLRVLADGTPRFVGDFWSGGVVGMPRIASDAAEVRVLYNGILSGEIFPYDAGTIWWRRAADGLSPPLVKLGSVPGGYSEAPAVAIGDDTLVLLATSTYGAALSLARVAADGSIVTPPYDVIRSQYGVGYGYQMVRRGPEVVIGWYGADGRIFLLRVGP